MKTTFKFKKKHVAGIPRTFYLSIEAINWAPEFRETIPLTMDDLRQSWKP
jgi:hypothetical protein